MEIATGVSSVRQIVRQHRAADHTIGLVPTMGCLHDGHLSLIRRAARDNDVVVVSIFVNPIQFGPSEDYERYPRDMRRDCALAEKAGCDIIFAPQASEMYPPDYKTYVEVENITNKLCGASRPGHFRGVTTVVSKLFNIIQPDRAYFGKKDYQQFLVIRQMVRDLNMPIEAVPVPIVREPDGLAMSSRNTYLSPEERRAARVLSRSLFAAQDMIERGEKDKNAVLKTVRDIISAEKAASIDYVEMADAETLEDIERVEGHILLALAVKIGKTRLIDNIDMEV